MPLRRSQYWRRPSTPVSTAIDGLSLTTEQATPEQIGLYLPTTRSVGAGSVSVRYRTTAGPGAWSTGHPLLRISTTGNEAGPTTLVDAFAGSIFDLTAGTQYDVELTHVESGQSTKVSTIQRTTRSLPAAAGAPNVTATTSDSLQTKFDALVAGDVLQLAAGTYTVSALTLSDSGTSGSPIYIRGVSRTGVIIKDTTGTVLSIAASHVILENLTIEGSSSDSDTAASSLGIGFSGAQTNVTVRNIDMVGVDRAINADGAQTGVLVYGCNLTGNNLWTSAFVDDNSTWNDDGVRLPGFGNCAWNNTLYGFGDAFAVIASERSEGIYFYRNRVEMTGDDAFEGDYATRNVAFYDNIITNCGTLLSLDPLYGGPLYCFRNTAINTIRGPYKLNTDQTGFLIYNNTVVRTDGSSLGGDGQFTSSITMSNYSKRNNLMIYRGVNRVLTSNNVHAAPLDNGYNAWYPNGGFQYSAESVDVANLAALQSALSSRTPLFGSTQRHVNDVITVTDPFAADITLGADHLTEYTGHTNVALTAGTSPKNAGVAIPGITDGFSGAAPDIGASIEGRAAITVGAVPQWVADLPLLTWSVLANTAVTDAGAGTGVSAYSGAIWDPVRKRVVVWGGGHFDSDDNGVYAVNLGLETPTATTLKANTGDTDGDVSAYNTDGTPVARHTYWNIQYSPTLDAMMALGGSGLAASEAKTNNVDAFYFATNTWSAEGTFTDRPGTVGFAESGCMDASGNGYIGASSFTQIQKWTPGTPGSWSTFASFSNLSDHPLAFDSINQRIVFFQDTAPPAIDGGGSRWTLAGTRTAVDFTGAGESVAHGNSWVFCPERSSFIGCDWGTRSIYECDASSFSVASLSISGTPPAAGRGGGHGQYYGRFGIAPELGLIFLITDAPEDIGVFRYR